MNFRDYLIAGRRVRLWGDVDKVVQMAVRSFQPFVAVDVVDKPLLDIVISTDIAFDTLAAVVGAGQATLEGTVLTIGGQTSAVLR